MTVILPEFPESEYTEPFYVKYFGFEIEGGFDEWHRGYDEDDEQNNVYFKHDGSVNCESGIAGEIASPRFRVDRMENFRIFARENMPIEANASAGLHVHVSFNTNEAYARCMDKEFIDKFYPAVKEFIVKSKFDLDVEVRFWERLDDQSNYCKNEFCPEYQSNPLWNRIYNSENGRYTHINYPFGQHQTIEARLFPSTTDPNELIKMVEFFIDFTNNYLKTQRKTERATRVRCVEESDEIMETELVCV
jgi:hypothetical protein